MSAPAEKSVSSLVPHIKSTKVSSVLNDSREYGKQNLFDGHAETCWNSAQGTPQYIQIAFQSPVDLTALLLTFQGGFVGKSVILSATSNASPKKFLPVQTWEPKDENTEQRFEVPQTQEAKEFTNIKSITFPTSTDFYGRITLYKLDILGKISENQATAAASPTTDASPRPSP